MDKFAFGLMIFAAFITLLVAVLNLAAITEARSLVSVGTILTIVHGYQRMRASQRFQAPFSLRRTLFSR